MQAKRNTCSKLKKRRAKVVTPARLKSLLLLPILLIHMALHSQESIVDIPEIIRVSVDHSDNTVVVEWNPSASSNLLRYNVYKMNTQLSFEKIATVDPDMDSFRDVNSGLGLLSYAVTAEDKEGNESLIDDNVHKAVSLEVEYDLCNNRNSLSWSAYEGWEGQIAGYRLIRKVNSGSEDTLHFVKEGTLSYEDAAIHPGSIYDYYIQTVHINNISSLSFLESLAPELPREPDYLQIDYVSVMQRGIVELQFTADISGPVNSFQIYRRVNESQAPYLKVAEVLDASQESNHLEDLGLTSSKSYIYRVQAVYLPGGCPNPILISTSDSSNTMLLQGALTSSGTFDLKWTPYRGFPRGCSGYQVQRRDPKGEFLLVAQCGPDKYDWTDPLDATGNEQPGKLEYRVLAIENPSGSAETGISYSNIQSLELSSNIELPTAFTPGQPGANGVNDIFKPVMDFGPEKYLLIVADRNGRKIFETSNPDQGWDGRNQGGGFVREGVYVYYLQYTDFSGIFKTLTGNITVLYP